MTITTLTQKLIKLSQLRHQIISNSKLAIKYKCEIEALTNDLSKLNYLTLFRKAGRIRRKKNYLKKKKLQAKNNTSQTSIKEKTKLEEIGCKRIINLLPHLQADNLNLKQKKTKRIKSNLQFKEELVKKLKILLELRKSKNSRINEEGGEGDGNEFFNRIKLENSNSTINEEDNSKSNIKEAINIEGFYQVGNDSIEGLIRIRKQWDKYITSSNNSGDKIPPGFINDPYPSSKEWAKYLK
ncbi:hypothetical protein CONCODRAFT_169276 [Conidiobolus coronatus NRRL 28638]|uniref:Uncharacterized protein n=1 Tax=Conidiobolus coronatus (strain ATCC 28846 / CBS 209.66 / NRRL 28638) TaxID=796925 RepID=A0A137PAK9_CONC2|nr:hypothetical protein CONCODRAFT_169276 [Conidiobolus coronatus NRRL 28638]|eukprot:KXN72059.1 hypothetical protein CONCODRAFT_169276 [Conidiobolus coronatus NRRL 28638]